MMEWHSDSVRFWLSAFMGDDAARYSDLDYAVSIIKQGEICWQAAASIAIQISLFNQESKPTKAEKALAQDTADSTIEPLEASIKSILDKPGKESAQEGEARALSHARFALGGLYIVKGDIERAADILTQVASTKSIVEVHRVKSSSSITPFTFSLKHLAFVHSPLCQSTSQISLIKEKGYKPTLSISGSSALA